jgi:tetratricopeptide (TPR) repeat protein
VILFGLMWFGLALAPTSQIMPHHIVRADRFLYLPLVGLAVATAAGLMGLGKVGSRRGATAATIAAGLLGLLLLGMLSARQVQTWRDRVSIWENCLRRDPNNAFAHGNLARNLADRGESGRALLHFQAALEISPDFAAGLSDFGRALAKFEDRRLRDYELAVRLAERACEMSDWKDRRIRRNLAIVHCDYGNDLQARGEFARAGRHYREAIRVDPEYELPVFSLALLLATCEDEDLRQPELAVRLAERGWELLEAPDAQRLLILAAVYAEAGRFREAAAAAREALPLAQAADDREMAEDLRRRFEHYRSQIPP